MIVVDGLHYAPIAFLLMTAAFRAMDPSLEESAMMSGATTWQIATRVTLRLAWPAVAASFLILFVRAIESFEVPALLGLPVGIEVFTSAIYDAIHRYPSDVGLACAYALMLIHDPGPLALEPPQGQEAPGQIEPPEGPWSDPPAGSGKPFLPGAPPLGPTGGKGPWG